MRTNPESPLFSFSNLDEITKIRRILEDAGYNPPEILKTVGVTDLTEIREDDIDELIERTSSGTSLETLIRLFLVGVPVSLDEVHKVTTSDDLKIWIDAGFLRAVTDEQLVEASVKLLPFGKLILAFDFDASLRTGKRENYVMGVGSSTITLANMTIRDHISSSLDLGTGCGILAFLCSPHSERVFAVDRNPRAIHITDFNILLNGLDNVETRVGDLFEPLDELSFDLIVSNPPFVISPRARFIFRDSGMTGDEICQKIVHSAGRFLNEGGYCQMLCNWAHFGGQDWRPRIAGWFEGSNCDAWVIRQETRDAVTYAKTWIRHTEDKDPEIFATRFKEWTEYYEQENIEAISAGLITLRKSSSSKNWVRIDDPPDRIRGSFGEDIVLGFKNSDFLETIDNDDSLLEERFKLSPKARLKHTMKPSSDGWKMENVSLDLLGGLEYYRNLDGLTAVLIQQIDGIKTMRNMIAEFADATKTDPQQIIGSVIPTVKEFVKKGFLERVTS